MKNIISILVFLAFLSSVTESQTNWVQINPGFGHNYRSLHFTDSLHGLACGNNGSIVKTTNGGMNWVNISSGTTSQMHDIKYLSSNIAIALGNEHLIIRSTDGGNTWNTANPASVQPYTYLAELTVFPNGQALAFSFEYTSPTEYKYILSSTNYGANWQTTLMNCHCRYVSFINMNTGWANGQYDVGSNFYITSEKSVNGGASWNVTNSFQTVSVNSDVIYFLNENTGFRFLNMVNILYKTYSSGSTWNFLMYMSSVDINSIYFADNNIGWFVGSQGAIYKTTNEGNNWSQQSSPVNTTLNKVFFINPDIGWIAAGTSGILINHLVNSVRQISVEIPDQFSLYQNYPNPFNPTTKIKFDIPTPLSHTFGKGGRTESGGFVRITILDVLGREIAVLVNEQLKPGTYEVEWDGSTYPSGVYFYKLITTDASSPQANPLSTETKKMVLLK